MEKLHWELSILTQAVAYGNLSGASIHVGLSQPQLSRIVAKIESELKVVLLDRTARRKSSWTPTALRLSEVYSKNMRLLTSDISQVLQGSQPTILKVGTLEGFSELALEFCRKVFETTSIRMLELDVYDLSLLEENFFKGALDIIFSFREPGRKKYNFLRSLGFQTIDYIENGPIQVLSPFEYSSAGRKKKELKDKKIVLSNSLEIRKKWINDFQGTGIIPSQIRREGRMKERDGRVYMIGSDQLGPALWEKLEGF